MIPTILSNNELKRFSQQMKSLNIGIEGQEILKYSELIINGLGGIGISALRCLIAAGIGRIKVIDNKIVNKEMLPTQTLFGENDIGKLRSLAAYENKINVSGNRIILLNTTMNSNNIDSIIGNAKAIIDLVQDHDLTNYLIDLAASRGLYLAGGFGIGWQGVYGIYCGLYKTKYKKIINELFETLHPEIEEQPYFSFMSNIIGGAIAHKVIRALLNYKKQSTSVFKIDMFNFKMTQLMGILT